MATIKRRTRRTALSDSVRKQNNLEPDRTRSASLINLKQQRQKWREKADELCMKDDEFAKHLMESYERYVLSTSGDLSNFHVPGCKGHDGDERTASLSEKAPEVPVVNKGYVITMRYTLDTVGPNCLSLFANGIPVSGSPMQYWVLKGRDDVDQAHDDDDQELTEETEGLGDPSSNSTQSNTSEICQNHKDDHQHPSNNTLTSDTASPTTDSTMTTSPLHSAKSFEACPPAEPRLVTLKKTSPDETLGITIVGGNAVGIFVQSVQSSSVSDTQKRLHHGDQILEYNGIDFRSITHEQALVEISKPVEIVSILAQYNVQKLKKILDQPGDSFYIRAMFDHQGDGEGELSFSKNEFLFVDNTVYNSKMGVWHAWKVDAAGNKLQSGSIPSKATRLEEVPSLKRRHSEVEEEELSRSVRQRSRSTRRSLVRKEKHQRLKSGEFSTSHVQTDEANIRKQTEHSAVKLKVADKSSKLNQNTLNELSSDKGSDNVKDMDYERTVDEEDDVKPNANNSDFEYEDDGTDLDFKPNCRAPSNIKTVSSEMHNNTVDSRFASNEMPRILFSCPQSKICLKKYTTQSGLDSHVRIHNFLSECESEKSTIKDFSSKSESDKTHDPFEKFVIELAENKNARCPIVSCNSTFSKVKYFEEHMLYVHMPDRGKFRCPKKGCKSTFATEVRWRQHCRVWHSGEDSCCDICGKILPNRVSLRKHRTLHTDGKRIYKCPVPGCNSDFAVKKYLSQHAKTHETSMNYLCQICGKSYKRSECLRAHFLSVSHKKMVESQLA